MLALETGGIRWLSFPLLRSETEMQLNLGYAADLGSTLVKRQSNWSLSFMDSPPPPPAPDREESWPWGSRGCGWAVPALTELEPSPAWWWVVVTLSGEGALSSGSRVFCRVANGGGLLSTGLSTFLFISDGFLEWSQDSLQRLNHFFFFCPNIAKCYRKINVLLFAVPDEIWFSFHSTWVLF